MLAVTEATFVRHVLHAELPVLACFGARGCPARQALRPALAQAAERHRGQLLVASVLVDHAPLLAEQYGVVASPTLMVFQHGERQSQVRGFLPDGLVRLLADEVVGGAVRGDSFWSPVEERFEDMVLIPLLERWGCAFQRQVACALPGRPTAQRGRIDLLVSYGPRGEPLTLIESKRQIWGDQDLQQAARQASAYARSLALPTFVVAAPRGLWVYWRAGERVVSVAHFTSLELHQAPERPRQLLLQLRADAALT